MSILIHLISIHQPYKFKQSQYVLKAFSIFFLSQYSFMIRLKYPTLISSKRTSSRNEFRRIYVAMRIMMGFFLALGLAPYKLKRIPEWDILKKTFWQTSDLPIKFRSSRLRGLYNIFLTIVQLGIVYMTAFASINGDYLGKSDITVTIEWFNIILGNGAVFVISMVLGSRRETTAKMLNRLVDVDNSLVYIKVYDSTRSFSVRTLSLIFDNVLMCVSLFTTHYWEIVTYLSAGLPSFVASMFVVQYAIAVDLITNRFRDINRAILGRDRATSILNNSFFLFVSDDSKCHNHPHHPSTLI